MRRISYLVAITILGLNQCQPKQSSDISSVDNEQDYVEAKFKNIDWDARKLCEIEQYEFADIYEELDSISSDDFERLAVVEKLKTMGFKETNWGRGNWLSGPRIVSFALTNGLCDCQVDKLYYNTSNKEKYKVTERIVCKPTSF
jgi:hypothetical protein